MPGTNLIVFRDAAERVKRTELLNRLRRAMEKIRPGEQESIVDALVISGQLESALQDSCSPLRSKVAGFTNELGALFVGPAQEPDFEHVLDEFGRDLPDSLEIAPLEGFSYYALHPGDFEDVVTSLPPSGAYGVIGIRSIGTTLSAVSMAALRKRGRLVSRITVRPTGHPYDRNTRFTAAEIAWIDRRKREGAQFLIVDEGPGLSGSSFLSVGESLVEQGVSAVRIVLAGTRDCDPNQLCAPDAARRWRQFGWRSVTSRICRRFSGFTPLSGGLWRSVLSGPESDWTACWNEMETLRFLSPDHQSIFKFEGFGEFGCRVRDRVKAVTEEGFGPSCESAGDGMNRYAFVVGRPLTPADLNEDILDRIARYCAFRADVFKASQSNATALKEMVRFNFAQERRGPGALATDGEDASVGFSLDCLLELDTDSPVITDSRMQPYEWIGTTDGKVLKVDASRHGDDHFFPGPTHIAWDLAGAIVEWNMHPDAIDYFLRRFSLHTGNDARKHLRHFLLAYSVFRMAYSKMALDATQNTAERLRLSTANLLYRSKVNEFIGGRMAIAS